jgi:hypothetical protein
MREHRLAAALFCESCATSFAGRRKRVENGESGSHQRSTLQASAALMISSCVEDLEIFPAFPDRIVDCKITDVDVMKRSQSHELQHGSHHKSKRCAPQNKEGEYCVFQSLTCRVQWKVMFRAGRSLGDSCDPDEDPYGLDG